MSAVFVFHTGGCAMSHKVAVNDTGAPQYERVDISYRIPASHSALARKVDGVVGLQTWDALFGGWATTAFI